MPLGERFFSRKSYLYPTITQNIIFNQNHNDGPTRFSEEELLKINDEYQSMVEDYCNRNLSCANDKFPALSGIVALLHKEVGGHYLAGIWSKSFRENLLWQIIASKAPHIKQYRAPSWSWAVTDESVSFHTNSSSLASTPHDPILSSHDIELSSENPYGSVKYAHIIVDTLTLKLIHLGQHKNPSNKIDFFLISSWSGISGAASLSPRIPRQEEGEFKVLSVGSVAYIPKPIGYDHSILLWPEFHLHLSWDEGDADWSAISPLKYKFMLVGLKQPKQSRPITLLSGLGLCLECLILQEDPEDAKVCRRVGRVDLTFTFDKEIGKPVLDALLASDRWERETLKLI